MEGSDWSPIQLLAYPLIAQKEKHCRALTVEDMAPVCLVLGSVNLTEAIKNFAFWMIAEKDIVYTFIQVANRGEIFRDSRKVTAGKPKAGRVWMENPTDDVIRPTAEWSFRHSSTQLTVLALIKTIFIEIRQNIANLMAMVSQE